MAGRKMFKNSRTGNKSSMNEFNDFTELSVKNRISWDIGDQFKKNYKG